MQITINNEVFKLVEYECALSLVEIGDSVQTLDGVNHIESRKLKRNISAKTSDLVKEDAYRLVNELRNTYLSVEYEDPLTKSVMTKIFILQNNPTFKAKLWRNGREYYEGIELDLLEKGAE